MAYRSIIAVGLLFCSALLFLSACSGSTETGEESFMATGLITRPDFRRCAHPCCGGWFIEIGEQEYRFFELPEGSDIELAWNEDNFPIKVRLNWSDFEDDTHDMSCTDDLIVIEKIERE